MDARKRGVSPSQVREFKLTPATLDRYLGGKYIDFTMDLCFIASLLVPLALFTLYKFLNSSPSTFPD